MEKSKSIETDVKQLIVEVLRWAANNHVHPSCGYWEKDYSIIAYTDEKIAEEFLKTITIIPNEQR